MTIENDHLRVVVLACLTAFTLVTLVEVGVNIQHDRGARSTETGSALDEFGLPMHDAATPLGGGDAVEHHPPEHAAAVGEINHIARQARERVSEVATDMEASLKHAFAAIDAVRASTRQAEAEVSRVRRRNERATVPTEQSVPPDAAAADMLRSGYLQLFDSIQWCEKLIASRIDMGTVSHQEKRAWRQRLLGVLHQIETNALGGAVEQRRKIEELEDKLTTVLSKWGRHFRKPDDDVNGHTEQLETHVLEMHEVGYEPIYRPLFSADAAAHKSEVEGQRLHALYNVRPQ